MFDCLKLLLTAMLQDEYELKVLKQMDSSFLFRNNMKIGAVGGLIQEIRL